MLTWDQAQGTSGQSEAKETQLSGVSGLHRTNQESMRQLLPRTSLPQPKGSARCLAKDLVKAASQRSSGSPLPADIFLGSTDSWKGILFPLGVRQINFHSNH